MPTFALKDRLEIFDPTTREELLREVPCRRHLAIPGGVTSEVEVDGSPVGRDEYGCFDNDLLLKKHEIVIETPTNLFLPLVVKEDNRDNRYEASELGQEAKPDGGQTLRRSFQVIPDGKRGRQGTPYPLSHHAHIRLLGFSQQEGDSLRVRLWNVAVVKQTDPFEREERIWLTQQQMFAHRVYRDKEGNIHVPACRGEDQKIWSAIEGMVSELKDVLADKDLPYVGEYELPPSNEQPERFYGDVLWFSERRGYGAVQTSKGVARLHHREIVTRTQDGLSYVLTGDRMLYRIETAPRPTLRGRDTGFVWEV